MRALIAVLTLAAAACTQAPPPAQPCFCPCASASVASTAAASASAAPGSTAPVAAPNDISALIAERKADEFVHSAQRKLAWHDGVGCIGDLDAHDTIDARPDHASTSALGGYVAMLRAQCLMRAGRCDAGRVLFRDAFQEAQGKNVSPKQLDAVVDATAGMQCVAPSSPRDRFIVARFTLQEGAWTTRKTSAECGSAYTTMMALRTTVTPRDEDDSLVNDPLSFLFAAAPRCFARAGDCAGAFRVYRDVAAAKFAGAAWTADSKMLRATFESTEPGCKGS